MNSPFQPNRVWTNRTTNRVYYDGDYDIHYHEHDDVICTDTPCMNVYLCVFVSTLYTFILYVIYIYIYMRICYFQIMFWLF